MDSASDLPPHSNQDSTTPTLEPARDSTLLRFPTPETDERISSWVESIAAAKMSSRSEDEGALGESAYEFIDTDTESRDDNATESIASTDFGRPDDVASLADTEQSESGEEDNSESAAIPAYEGLDQAVDQAFETPTIGRSSAIILEDSDRPLAQSIEFEEPFSLGAENVSVKHTVTKFNEEETARLVKSMILESPPQRLVVTIQQTMTKQGLSTRDPLRILYVGSHSAKQDIIHKIASSVTASVEGGNRAQHLRHSASQLYNVVPVSAFGSERTPEIELMHSSGYQIKVEDCTFAQTLKFEDAPEKPDVIKLTLEDSFSYHSVPDGQSFIVEPHWELPQIALFYCSDGDDSEARRTRAIARKFMSRHNIPSIVISHKQLFERDQCMSLDQHSIHMCLESRDSNGRGNVIYQRLPIDLASFLNIDARQMNRNLAYLTGLHEPLEEPRAMAAPIKLETMTTDAPDVEKTPYSISDSVNFIRNRNGAAWRALLPVGFLLLSVLAAVFTGIPSYRFSSKPAISINSKIVSNIPISSTSSSTSLIAAPSVISTATSTAVTVSTRTITVTEAQSAGPNSLSVVPSMEIGKTSQKFQTPQPINKSICSAEILGDREILIRIPSATKLSWLTKEAISVNITRGNDTVDTERAYSSDEGIVLLLPKKDAHGVLNISIVTTKKPRVNETFQVDFGTSPFQAWQNLVDKMTSLFSEEFSAVDPLSMSEMRSAAEKMVDGARTQSQSTLDRVEEVRKMAMDQAALATESVTEIAKAMSLEAAKRSAIISKEVGIRLAETEAKLAEKVARKMEALNKMQEPFNEGLFKAQVKSRLVWLKMQGKDKEYRDYEKAASDAIRSKFEEAKKARKEARDKKFRKKAEKDKRAEGKKKKADRLAKKAAKKEARAAKKQGKKQKA
ncbi:hypothetical protein G7Y89_g6384 [Cudoniella acicularis]|uniref:Uncharacterized protein n=1 Tax=Cudoniella acicularis TaxID=354080 RepID=A0A8H4RMC1_9HELO|nr:hypothetical protein G7Y89_g6384 [Cudoniella acicularis]